MHNTTNYNLSFQAFAETYLTRLNNSFTDDVLSKVESLSQDLLKAWSQKKTIFICGNGGSAANALHIANDLHYGIGACRNGQDLPGLHADALPANQGIITCLANDTGFENIFSQQLDVKGKSGDILIVLSGSGNSPNVINALTKAKELNIKSYSIVAYSGGECKKLSDICIHFKEDDMQMAEDSQLIVGHLCMQWLNLHKPTQLNRKQNG